MLALTRSRTQRSSEKFFGGYDSDDSERGGDDEFNDMCEVSAFENAEMMGWDTYGDDYVGS